MYWPLNGMPLFFLRAVFSSSAASADLENGRAGREIDKNSLPFFRGKFRPSADFLGRSEATETYSEFGMNYAHPFARTVGLVSGPVLAFHRIRL